LVAKPVSRCAVHRRQIDQRANADVRRWYRTARWAALKAQVRREQPLCDDCQAEGHVTEGTQTDHTIPHRGVPALFWDRQNLRNKCDRHHALKTRRGE